MLIQLLNQARGILGGRRVADNTIWYGQFGFSLNDSPYVWGKNRVVNQGLNHILNAALRNTDAVANWYIVPFAADVTPGATLTALTFGSTLTEFTNYDEATRPIWTPDAAATVQLLENAAAPAVYTVADGAQVAIYGAGLISVATKSSTSGQLFSAAKSPSPFLSLADGFEVKIKYRVTGTSS